MAVLLAAVKPKNLLLTVGAAVAVAETGVSTSAQVGALAVFVLRGRSAPASRWRSPSSSASEPPHPCGRG